MPPVVFTAAARAEMFEAADWYESHGPGLGARFVADMDVLVARLRERPQQFPRIRQEIRRALFRKFPYALYFRINPDLVQVIACFHASRDPRRWHERAS
ncbi:MAG TPA: type II toxin-antitoxin system RelE/ParE family toxin [Candidatus Omnitrophota bacterium]|nr:type II toxin-antitoxin system RelE/ParE family toxin [Candidatus Omnitrophota bacterium]